jgi:CRP/FNR family transcriptional regulator
MTRPILLPTKREPHSCEHCSLNHFCLVGAVDPGEAEKLEQLVQQSRVLQRGEHLFRQGDRVNHLYVVKAGSLKAYESTPDGLAQVVAFYLPGELLGLDGLGSKVHNCSAEALETTSVCALSIDRLNDLCGQVPSLHREMCRIVGREIATGQDMLLLLGQRTAEERLATFLLSLSSRHRQRGYSAREFNLSMPRQDIASFLGLVPETVSRLLANFRQKKLIAVDQRHVWITDFEGLRELAKLCAPCPAAAASKVA